MRGLPIYTSISIEYFRTLKVNIIDSRPVSVLPSKNLTARRVFCGEKHDEDLNAELSTHLEGSRAGQANLKSTGGDRDAIHARSFSDVQSWHG